MEVTILLFIALLLIVAHRDAFYEILDCVFGPFFRLGYLIYQNFFIVAFIGGYVSVTVFLWTVALTLKPGDRWWEPAFVLGTAAVILPILVFLNAIRPSLARNFRRLIRRGS